MILLYPVVSIVGLLIYMMLISIVETSYEGVHYDDNIDSHHDHQQRRYHYSDNRYDIKDSLNRHSNYMRDSKLIYFHTFKMITSTITPTTTIHHSSTVRLQYNDSSTIIDHRRLSIHSIMNTSTKGAKFSHTSTHTSSLSSHLSSHISQSCLPILSVSLNIDPHKYLNRLINRYAIYYLLSLHYYHHHFIIIIIIIIVIYHRHHYHHDQSHLSS